MEWRPLEEHFRVATTQEPGPCGEDAVEWDYSRYARGLGLSGQPGAHDLPHQGCAVLALPPSRWAAAAAKYRGWAEMRGWSCWRVSARATVVLPDPVLAALGSLVSGSESAAFGGAARPYRPAAGRRGRSPGLGVPLSAGERWLIAADRLRRRLRAETAVRGIVVLVEEAERLTPGALGVLMHLLDAHRAWRARMLSHPALFYLVLLTAPEHEREMLGLLERFRMKGHPTVGRERRRADAGAEAPAALPDRNGSLRIEEERLLGAISAAPLALAEEDLRHVFGESSIHVASALAERGVLRRRVEGGAVCYLPEPAFEADAEPPAPRVLHALAERYRQRARRGHDHLLPAAAALAVRLGEPVRAAVAVARMPYTAGAIVPSDVFGEIDRGLERFREALHADHLAAWLSLRAHQRDYERARELADALSDRDIRTWRQLRRTVEMLLCAGRGHLDACLPSDFWPKLKSTRISGPFMDATCVLAELFWRKRYLKNSDVSQRHDFALECWGKADPLPAGGARSERALRDFVRLMIYRAALGLEIPSEILADPDASPHATTPATLVAFLRSHRIPAYIASTVIHAEMLCPQRTPQLTLDTTDYSLAMALGRTSGHSVDLLVLCSNVMLWHCSRGASSFLRGLGDEYLVLAPSPATHEVQRDMCRVMQVFAGARECLASASSLLLPQGGRHGLSKEPLDDALVARALLRSGEYAAARDQILSGVIRRDGVASQRPHTNAIALQTLLIGARMRLDDGGLDHARALLELHRTDLGLNVYEHLVAFHEGSSLLLRGKLVAAEGSFQKAELCLGKSVLASFVLRAAAAQARRLVSHIAGTIADVARRGMSTSALRDVLRRLAMWAGDGTLVVRLDQRLAQRLEYCVPLIESWARHRVGGDHEDVLRVAMALKEAVDSAFSGLGTDFVGIVSRRAPTFYEQLRAAILEHGGDLTAPVPEARNISAALRLIEPVWVHDPFVQSIRGATVECRMSAGWSERRNARAVEGAWTEDVSGYFLVKSWLGTDGKCVVRRLVRYGVAGGASIEPKRMELDVRLSPREGGTVSVVIAPAGRPAEPAVRRTTRKGFAPPALHFEGSSKGAVKVREMIEAAARCRYPTLIVGETGVGKELVAKCVHAASERQGRPMIVAECGTTAEGVLESELFGHERGSFTGAHARHAGYFERANGSTLLLDEVDSMSVRMQAALLRVLESGEYRPVGADVARRSDFRLISAALPRLFAMLETRQFREDLFYRISALRIEVPPLREREGDSTEIATAYVRSLGLQLTSGALRAIGAYPWPGNVRQLRHCIEAASIHSSDGRIGEAAMVEAIGVYRGGAAARSAEEAAIATDALWRRVARSLRSVTHFGAWEFAEAAQLSRRSAQRHLAKLLREGRIRRFGAGRATRYAIAREEAM